MGIAAPPILLFHVDKIELGTAVENTKQELVNFAKRLEQINSYENLNIIKIDNILICYDDNY